MVVLTDLDWLIALVGSIVGTIVLTASIYWVSKWKWKRIDLKKARASKRVSLPLKVVKKFGDRLTRLIDT